MVPSALPYESNIIDVVFSVCHLISWRGEEPVLAWPSEELVGLDLLHSTLGKRQEKGINRSGYNLCASLLCVPPFKWL